MSKQAKEAWALINANVHEPMTIPEIAKLLEIPPRILRDQFRAVYDIDMRTHVQDVRFNEIERMVKHTEMKVSEMAEAIQMSPSGVLKLFADRTGMTIGDCRKRLESQ